MNNEPLQEVQYYNHMGITVCAFDSSSKRTTNLCNRAKSILGALSQVGVKHGGLNPIYSANLWEKYVCRHSCSVLKCGMI